MGRAPLTFAGLVSWDVLGPQPLVQDVKHLPAQIQEEQWQRPHRHGARDWAGLVRRPQSSEPTGLAARPRGQVVRATPRTGKANQSGGRLVGGALKASVHWAEWQGTGPGIGPRRKGRILRAARARSVIGRPS